MAGVVPAPNETDATLTRSTRDGRELFYHLKVIQQPERARACGSGAKSSADRRPVDPPPVVELKIFEVEGDKRKDVTFAHNANFFLFTTLEPARQIAHGRVPQTQAMAPVLTGAPVAGMVYLDRPQAAGYFIFPDLSVRHEGKYRLSFSLYEDVKEDKDADTQPVEGSPATQARTAAGNAMSPRAHVHFRLEVKSTPFDVFSAKKFPGLSESTNLSRTVAEQGCRVRIRRDVRVRRRDKQPDGFPGTGEEGHYAGPDRYATPQHLPDRPRSISNGSVDAATPFNLPRRPSMELGYYPQPNAYQPTPPPAPIQSATSYHSSHLNFGGSSTPTYQTPSFQKPSIPPPPPLAPSATQHYAPPPTSNSYSYPPPSPSHSRQLSTPQNYGYQSAQQAQQLYGQQPPEYKQEYQPAGEPRRASISMSLNPEPRSTEYQPYVQNPSGLGQHSGSNQNRRSLTPINTGAHQSNTLPPVTDLLQRTPPVDRTSVPASASSAKQLGPPKPYHGSGFSLSSYASSSITPHSSTTAYSSDPMSARYSSNPPSAVSDANSRSKRGYTSAFSSFHFDQPQRDGMRPDPNHYALDTPKIETDDGELTDLYGDLSEQLLYKRANGTMQAKHCQTRSPPKLSYKC